MRRRQSMYAWYRSEKGKAAWWIEDASSDDEGPELVVLVVPVRVARFEVLVPRVVGRVLRPAVLSTSPGRPSVSRETAPDLPVEPVVSVTRMSVPTGAAARPES